MASADIGASQQIGVQWGRNGEICSHANGSSPSRPSGSGRRDAPAQTELVVGTQLMGETTIVTFAGEIDVATMKQFAGMLRMHLNDGAPIVLIDMAEVGFASAGSVMRVLLTAIREARTRGAVVQVLLSPAVRRVAAVLGVVGECEAEAGVSAKIGGAESAAMVAYRDSQSSTCTSSRATVRISDRTA